MPGSKFDRIDISRMAQLQRPVTLEPEVRSLAEGLRLDVSPRLIPLSQATDMNDVRFEGQAIRKDFGWVGVGEPTTQPVLALAEHKFVDGGITYHRLLRARQGAGDIAVLEVWDGTDWDFSVSSSETTEQQKWKPLSTLGGFYIATGGYILQWSETPSPSTIEDDFAAAAQIDETDYTTTEPEVSLSSAPADGREYIVSYEAVLTFKVPMGGTSALMEVTVEIEVSDDNGSSWTSVDSNTLGLRGSTEDTVFTESWVNANAIRRTIDLTGSGLGTLTDVRVHVTAYSITGDYVSEGFDIYPTNKSDGDNFAGVEYEYSAVGGSLAKMGASTPTATYIFAFADRIIALQADSDPQKIAWCISGDPTDWSGAGSGTNIPSDTKSDPVDAVMCGVRLSSGNGIVIRQRSILRLRRTGSSSPAIAILEWLEGVGTESPFSLDTVRGGAMFLGHDLMVYYISESGLQPVGIPLHEQLIKDVTGNLDLVEGRYDPIFEEYWLGVPEANATKITQVYIFNVGEFLNEQKLVWRAKSMNVQRFGSTSEVL